MLYKGPRKMNIPEEMLGETGIEQQHKRPRLKGATMSEEGEDIWQVHQEDHRAGGYKANSWNFH
jgi:hypothetical protein